MQDNGKCGNCAFYKAFYTAGLNKFEKSEYGLCGETDGVVKREEKCECYKKRAYHRVVTPAAIDEFNNAITKISELWEIFTDDNGRKR